MTKFFIGFGLGIVTGAGGLFAWICYQLTYAQ
jgi:hypothetical protein